MTGVLSERTIYASALDSPNNDFADNDEACLPDSDADGVPDADDASYSCASEIHSASNDRPPVNRRWQITEEGITLQFDDVFPSDVAED